MDNQKKPLMGSPPRHHIPPLLRYPMNYPAAGPYSMTSPYSYPGARSRPPAPPYYHNPPYMNGDAFYPYPHAVPVYPHRGAYGPHYPPFNYQGGPPLLPRPPPLMPSPHMYGHRGRGFPVQQQFQGIPGYSFRYESPRNSWHPNPSVSQTQTQYSSDGEKCTTESPSLEVLPFMPSVPRAFHPHPEYIKTFKFLEDPGLLGALKDGEMLIRGFLYEYDLSNDKGYLRSGSNLIVEVSKNVMYIMGRKIQDSESFQDVLAVGTNIKALIKKIPTQKKEILLKNLEANEAEESDAKYIAILAWFGEIPDVAGVMPTIERSKYLTKDVNERDLVAEDISSSKNDVSSNSEEDANSDTESELSHILGYVWWANKDQGIMRLYLAKGWGSEFSGILFTADAIHFENQQVNCEKLHFLAAHLNKCNVKARRIESKLIHGMVVNWKAVHIECGQFSHSLLRNELSCNIQSTTSNHSYCEELFPEKIHNDDDDNADVLASSCPIKVSSATEKCSIAAEKNGNGKYVGKNFLENNLCVMKDLQISCDNDIAIDFKGLFHDVYSGKHLTGHIIKLSSTQIGVGVAQWKSMDYGCVNILFKQNDMFVDLIPINKIMQLSSILCSRRCNLYVLPVIKDQDFLGFKIKLAATCGWVGTKPMCIPTPGEQPNAKVSLCHLEIDSGSESKNDADGQTSEEKSLTPSQFSSPLNGTKARNGADFDLNKKLTPLHMKSSKENLAFNKDGEEDDDGYQTGNVTEVHCKMGKIVSKRGESHYFYREQCYLFGISLRYVELWHVLVHGQKISFSLNRNPKMQVKIDKVLISEKDSDPWKSTENQIEYLIEWCKNNAVTDCAKDILVKQLKKTVKAS